jgi:DNA-binding NtrC family response regulator
MVAMPRPLHALVVDDDRGVRLAVGEALEAAGHRPFPAASAEEAIEVVRFHPVHFSILDVHVRADDGLRIFASLRQVTGSLPVIFISGAFTPDIVERAQGLGAHRCLDKPLDIHSLLGAVAELIDLESL